jgi:hypothetical protein
MIDSDQPYAHELTEEQRNETYHEQMKPKKDELNMVQAKDLKEGWLVRENQVNYQIDEIRELDRSIFSGRFFIVLKRIDSGLIWKFHCSKKDLFEVIS